MKLIKEIRTQVKSLIKERNDSHQNVMKAAWQAQVYKIIKEKEPELFQQTNFWKTMDAMYNNRVPAADAAEQMMAEPGHLPGPWTPNSRATRLRAFPSEEDK